MLHYVWSTKNRLPLINENLRTKLIEHIKEYAKENEIEIDTMNVVADHVHLLISISPVQVPSKVINLIKGESSNWINSNNLSKGKFSWQEGYGVFSVSYSNVKKVRKYIMDQIEHHRKVSYLEEVDNFLQAYHIKEEHRERR